ncbi:UNVERIFIED_CONTAM: Retrovirus-related Pol polyprotein from transposon TNT 1-94 [Sesamum radiatum]|uniref:Retrovirus-related Pol polyprotein from transposon TNT 1-94 n=1 Tax=Sesamum radiatum TaxID=300843 RepID=A0AAW2V696_SESRA
MRTEEANRLKDKEISNSSFSIKANLVEPSESSKDRFQHKGQKFKKNVQQKSHKGNDGKIQKNKCQCYCCGKTGHKAYQCYQRKDQQKTNKKQNPQLNLAETEEIIAAVVVKANLVENKVDWILDTWASKHFCANKELFHEFHEASDGECIFMENSTTAGVMGKGKVLLKLTSGKILALLDVLKTNIGTKTFDCAFIGYAQNSAAYRFMSLHDNSIRESRDAEFFELIFLFNKELDNQIASLNKFDSSSNSSMENVVEIRRSKRQKIERSFGPNFLTSFLTEDLNRIDEQFVSAFLVDEDPKIYVEAITSIDSSFWKEAIKNELKSIMTNRTWDLVDLLVGSKPIKCKWIFKKKIKPNGSIDKFKARLVVVGYTQKKGIDYFDTYSLVTKIATIRALIALSAINDLMIHQMDVKTAFLNGDLEEEIYMEQPEGFVVPRLESKFDMKDLGEADVILGVKIRKTENGFSSCQSHYIEKILKRFNCHEEIPVRTPYDPSICLKKNNGDGVLEGFCDANWVTDNDEVSSTSGYVFTLGGGAISWKSAKHTCIARSTMEYEFIALELTGQEAEWLRNLIGDIPLWGSTAPVSLHCDSQAAIGIAKNYAYNGKRRHIRLKHSAVKELLKNGIISLDYVRSERNLADPLTKGLTRRIIQETSRAMGLKPLEL